MSAGFQLARAMSGALLVLGLAAQQSAPLNQDGNAEQALRQELERRPGDVVALSRLGGVLDSQQKCAEAERVYRIALSRQPPSPALLNNLGNHYLACGDPREARAWFERLLRINPAHNNANLQMARIAVDQKHGVQALGYLAHIRESGPAIDLLRAEALYWSGQRDSALATLDRIGREAAGDARVLFSLGLLYARLERYDRAEAAFQALLAEHPAELEVALNLGRAALRAGHYERAQQVLEAALKRQPECVDALSELGQLHAALHDYDRAVLLLARARKLAPKRADILLWLARAAADASYYGDSVQAYDEYLSLRPDDDEVRRDRAVTYARMERNYPDVGLKELLRYVERHPADPLGHYDLALVYGYTDQEKALRELTEALRLDPALGPAHYARALLLHTADSIPDLEVVLRLNPQDTRALDQLGRIYLALEKPAEAERVLRQALAISPDFPEGLMDLGRALIEQGRKDEGVSYLQRFRDLRSQRQPFYGPWLIEAAGMPPGEVRRRVIEGLRQTCRARPDDADVRLELGTVLLSQGQVEEASAVLRELLALKAGAQTLHKAGLLLLRSEQYGLARELLERAAAERPSARLDLAIALLFADSAERALECLEAIPERERSGDYYLLKARILDAQGQQTEAERVLLLGVNRATSQPQVAREAAVLLVRHGRNAEALDLLDRALESSADDPDLLFAKAAVLSVANRVAAAEKALKEIESRWPEWDRPYLVHGLLLECGARTGEARYKIQTALALGSDEPAARSALGRLVGSPVPNPNGACRTSLHELLTPSTGKAPQR